MPQHGKKYLEAAKLVDRELTTDEWRRVLEQARQLASLGTGLGRQGSGGWM